MPALPDLDASTGLSFGLEVDGIRIARITRISGLRMARDVIEKKENGPDGRVVTRRLPGRPTPGEVTVTRLVTDDDTFEGWVRAGSLVQAGGPSPASASIVLVDVDGQLVKRYVLVDAWPRSLGIGTMKAGSAKGLTESLVLAYASIEPQ